MSHVLREKAEYKRKHERPKNSFTVSMCLSLWVICVQLKFKNELVMTCPVVSVSESWEVDSPYHVSNFWPIFLFVGTNGEQNFDTGTWKLVRLGDWLLLVPQQWWSAVDWLFREWRQTTFQCKGNIWNGDFKCDYTPLGSYWHFSLF